MRIKTFVYFIIYGSNFKKEKLIKKIRLEKKT